MYWCRVEFTYLYVDYSSPFLHLCGCIFPPRNIIFSFLSPEELGNLACTNWSICNAMEDFQHQAFANNRFLGQYFDDLISFWIFQAHTSTLLTGSFVLSFMEHSMWKPNDLDIYVWPDFTLEAIKLLLDEGYSPVLNYLLRTVPLLCTTILTPFLFLTLQGWNVLEIWKNTTDQGVWWTHQFILW